MILGKSSSKEKDKSKVIETEDCNEPNYSKWNKGDYKNSGP